MRSAGLAVPFSTSSLHLRTFFDISDSWFDLRPSIRRLTATKMCFFWFWLILVLCIWFRGSFLFFLSAHRPVMDGCFLFVDQDTPSFLSSGDLIFCFLYWCLRMNGAGVCCTPRGIQFNLSTSCLWLYSQTRRSSLLESHLATVPTDDIYIYKRTSAFQNISVFKLSIAKRSNQAGRYRSYAIP